MMRGSTRNVYGSQEALPLSGKSIPKGRRVRHSELSEDDTRRRRADHERKNHCPMGSLSHQSSFRLSPLEALVQREKGPFCWSE